MKIKQTMLAISALGIVGVAPLAMSTQANALTCTVLPQSLCDSSDEGDLESSGIWQLIILVINILTALIGFVAVGVIAYAAFLYTTAQDSSEQTKQAKEMIRNVMIGLLVYVMMWAGLQWLIPGGIFA